MELNFDSIFTSVSTPNIGSLKSLSNVGSESGEEIYSLCCIAFLSVDAAVGDSPSRHDIGKLRFRSIARQSLDRRQVDVSKAPNENASDSSERSIIIWRATTTISAAGIPLLKHVFI